MDRFYDMDKYGNIDTNKDGKIDAQDKGYQTDILYSPTGIGSSGMKKDASWVKNAFNEDGTLKKGDWAGDIGDTNNAMDDLLKSDKFNNGRIPDVSMVDSVKISSSGDIVIVNDNKQTGVKGIVEESRLSNIFLSDMNTKVIQDTLRYNVYKDTKMIVDYQSNEELYIVMRSILLQYANFRISQKNLVEEIKKLNKMVIKYVSHKVVSNLKQYNVYISDIQKLPKPNPRPWFSNNSSRNRSQDMSKHIGI